MPVTEMTKERRSYRYAVEGEAPIDRPYSGSILPDVVEISYQRDQEHAWHLRSIRVEGTRPKKDGKPSQVFINETWYDNPATPGSDETQDLPVWLLTLANWHLPSDKLPLPSGAVS